MNHYSSSSSSLLLSSAGQQEQHLKSRKLEEEEEEDKAATTAAATTGNSVFLLLLILSYVNRPVLLSPSDSTDLHPMDTMTDAANADNSIPSRPRRLADPTGVYSPLKVSRSVPNNFGEFEREWLQKEQRVSMHMPMTFTCLTGR
jgi:hypothetical protein